MTGQKALSPLLAALAIQMLAISLAGAQPVADFYQGKTLTLFIGADSGGGYDLFARTLSRHLAAHVPGGPAIVPSNMPGAGSMVLGNYLAKVAPRAFRTVSK